VGSTLAPRSHPVTGDVAGLNEAMARWPFAPVQVDLAWDFAYAAPRERERVGLLVGANG